ncbi:tetratricopeptide repeat protein [Sutcliffiella rhizosphaerae]|uniref:Tetratricopeptide repeat protein n=1 Tax=Sutcliffiella rhizosphaerae TaxID=2880967 RepID=A0ABM8YTV3_9BACI|nr:hypothetical protein [Sutcliffiella rhizosphaerae]CAG9623396.1 hypothetical protein BACCIP111883_04207 [Sutcliffiella rhizosphaerae]
MNKKGVGDIKKTFYLFIIATFFIVIFLIFFNFNKGYDLPPVSSMEIEELGLEFEAERKTEVHEKITNAELITLIENDMNNFAYLNELRIRFQEPELIDQFINSIESLKLSSEAIHMQLAMAYIDKLQDPALGTARLGQVSVKSINELNKVIQINENNWLAYYARGLNNLYWPIGLRRIDQAINDLAFCVALAKVHPHIENEMWPYSFVALGDALIKKGDLDDGFAIWKEGLELYPNDKQLQKRVLSGKDLAFEIVKETRGIDSFQRPENNLTDLSTLWEDEAR